MVEIRSTSSEDFSVIDIEFDENITIDDAKQKVKDLVDGVKKADLTGLFLIMLK